MHGKYTGARSKLALFPNQSVFVECPGSRRASIPSRDQIDFDHTPCFPVTVQKTVRWLDMKLLVIDIDNFRQGPRRSSILVICSPQLISSGDCIRWGSMESEKGSTNSWTKSMLKHRWDVLGDTDRRHCRFRVLMVGLSLRANHCKQDEHHAGNAGVNVTWSARQLSFNDSSDEPFISTVFT